MRILVSSLTDIKKTANSRLHQFLRFLANNHRITLICLNAFWIKKNDAKIYDDEYYNWYFQDILEKIEIRYLTEKEINPILQEAGSFFYLRSVLREINPSSFDIHFNYNTPISGYLTARYLSKFGVPTIFDIADDLPRRFRTSSMMPMPLGSISEIFGRISTKLNIDISSRVTYITESLRREYGFPIGKSVRIPNGVDIDLFQPSNGKQIRSRLGILDNDFVVGFVGTLLQWIDFIPIFSALKSLGEKGHPNIKMLIVGEEGRFVEIRRLVKSMNLDRTVFFTGTIPYTEVSRYISCMDICLIALKPTKDCQNCLPLTLFEYMACGKPVISTRLAGIEEAVGDKILYYSNNLELEDNLLRLLNSPSLKKSLGEEGRNYVIANYSWKEITKNLENIMLEILR